MLNPMGDIQRQIEQATGFTHLCPNCNSRTRCEVEAGKGTCWCFFETAAPEANDSYSPGSNCLCKSCLTGKTLIKGVQQYEPEIS